MPRPISPFFMAMRRQFFLASLALGLAASVRFAPAQTVAPVPLAITGFSSTNGQRQLQWTPYPAVQQYKILHGVDLGAPLSADSTGAISGYNWLGPSTGPIGFYQLQAVTLDPQALLTSTLLNRLAYGPTPDELERVRAIGPDAYIAEQLAPELLQENLDFDTVSTNFGAGWQYFTATGNGSGSKLYLYLNARGECYLDDIKLVEGTVAEAGTNLVKNGDFEAPLSSSNWTVSASIASSGLSTNFSHSGNASLRLYATSAGSTSASVTETISGLSTAKKYTLSYWFHPGLQTLSSPTLSFANNTLASTPYPVSFRTKLEAGVASLEDLRAWHVLHAVRSKRQLLETLLQFFDNHFVTQYTKSSGYFGSFYSDETTTGQVAVQLEFKQLQRWRAALLNPTCTFQDLLRISAECPQMIIYLDTVASRGDGSNIANENYGRELMELFTFGVNNGYDQNDIVQGSKAWTGWSVGLVNATNEFNPLAPRLTDTGIAATNLAGVWTFSYRTNRHNESAKIIFPNKTVPARFGPPYAGRSYQLSLPARKGAAGLQDGYDVITAFADQPFTQEFISVKLCRLLVHDNFNIGYDFTDPNLSPEGQLIKQCMAAWENGSPKGQIRSVLATIFNSDLFRGNSGSLQKVKTPLEYTVSGIRALRSLKSDGSYTSDTDGVLSTPLNRMGSMNLFDREAPDGYPETAPGWVSAGTLSERLRWIQALMTAPSQRSTDTDAGNSTNDPVALVKMKLPAVSWTNAAAVSDYFLDLVYSGEGKANVDLLKTLAVNFLNTADDGVTASPFSALSMTGNPSPYDTRLRGMLSALLTQQRFHEQ